MIGKHEIVVESINIRYRLELKRKYTIIRDITGNGKTMLVQLINDYYRKIKAIKIDAEYPVYVAPSSYAFEDLCKRGDCFIFVDDEPFLNDSEFITMTQESSAYFALFSRYSMKSLVCNISEVCEFDKSYDKGVRVTTLKTISSK